MFKEYLLVTLTTSALSGEVIEEKVYKAGGYNECSEIELRLNQTEKEKYELSVSSGKKIKQITSNHCMPLFMYE